MRKTRLKYATGAVTVAVVVLMTTAAVVRVNVDNADKEHGPESTGGARLFREKGCGQCHVTDRTSGQLGPGLKGILDREKLPVSGRAASRANVRKQIIDPWDTMPSYADRLSDEQMRRLLDYLETL
jgi:mono/diheme cytochrome c family protein